MTTLKDIEQSTKKFKERNKKRIKDANELIKRADDFLEKFNRKKTTSKYESVDSYETGGEVRGTGLSIKRTFKVY
jgi:hypothetical protein